MSLLEDFDTDVFISYAHLDNLPDREGSKGWVEEFEQQLSVRLLKRFGEPVKVWRDPELGRAQLYDKVIEKAIRGAGVMIALISSRYLKSEYCEQEIEWFRQKAEAEASGLVVGDYTRVFPVLLYNIPPPHWPEVCRGASAFKFFHAESDADFGEPLDPASESFQTELRKLVAEVHTVLSRLQEDAADRAAPAAPAGNAPETAVEVAGGPPEEPSFRVFLAHPSDDLGPTRRRLAAALTEKGLGVISNIPPPYEPPAHAEAVKEALAGADLAVHLVSSLPGEPMDESDPGLTYPLEQMRLGLEHGRSQLILMPEELDFAQIEHASYAELLCSLTERERDADRLELVQVGRPQMLDEILAKRRQLEEAAKRAEEADGSPGTAFIDLQTSDLGHAAELVGYLAQKQIAPIMVPAADLSPTAGMAMFEENLKKSSLFIVVFGAAARTWVEHRLQEAFKIILSQQLSTQIGVYVAPPVKPPEQVSFPPLFDVAVNMEGFDPTTLEALLHKAASSGG